MTGIIFMLFHLLHGAGTDPYPRNHTIDVLHYTFRIAVNDTTNVISGRADVTVLFRQTVKEFQLNLINKDSEGFGMEVFEVTLSGKPVHYVHRENKISLSAPNIHVNDTLTFSISYKGEPRDGLVIGKNKFGDRTFFGDNWPDRGQYWLPAVDHPYDKAKVDFIVTAPSHYQVVATGQLVSATELKNGFKQHHWQEKTDVAIKVVTIGIARFSIQQSGTVNNIPITTWVFPQNEQAGFQDFAVAPRVFEFMENYIGPYPYEKLAHVQSKTRFGGLENASNIFYFENSVNGKREREGLIAHETAHQWFGNSVTEDDWYHVWLSEGFATYLAALYMGSMYGDERLALEMANDRTEVIKFYQKQKSPIIDTTIIDINSVLSTNTYQKAAWVLHMLRTELGADCFKRGIQAFYSKYRDSNALTDDFRDTMESTCGRDLDGFFSTWLTRPGHPRLNAQWRYDAKAKGVNIMIETSSFPVPVGTSVEVTLETAPGKLTTVKYPLQPGRGPVVVVPAERKPSKVILDPRTILLFEGGIQEKP